MVHSFQKYPDATEASKGYALVTGEEKLNHSHSSKTAGGNAMPELKSMGPYAVLVIPTEVHESSAPRFYMGSIVKRGD